VAAAHRRGHEVRDAGSFVLTGAVLTFHDRPSTVRTPKEPSRSCGVSDSGEAGK
jgi:hypothetical protein